MRMFLCVLVASSITACWAGAATLDSPAELRKADMAAERAYLEKRLNAVPEKLPELREKLKAISKNYGITGLGILFRIGEDTDAVVEDRPIHPDAIKTLTDFSNDLKARGIDLIVVPVPNQVMTYAHRLHDDIPASANVWPGYTKGLMQLIDADVEVLDLSEAFATHEGKDLVMRRGDHHWNSAGMALAAKMVADRLDRYPHLDKFRDRRDKDFKLTREDRGIGTSIFSFNKLWSSRKKRGIRDTFKEVREMTGLPATEAVTRIRYSGELPIAPSKAGNGRFRFNDLRSELLVGGDSMTFHHAGSTFPAHVGRELGRPIANYGVSGGAAGFAQVYAERLSVFPTQPKVVVMVFRAGPMSESEGKKVWRSPRWPDPKKEATDLEKFTGKVRVKLTKVTTLPDPDTADYEDAIASAQAEITTGPHKGESILLQHWGMQKREPDATFTKWKAGDSIEVDLTPWSAALKKNPALETIMLLDDIQSLTLPQFWVTSR